MGIDYLTEDQKLGVTQSTTVQFGAVYKVAELSSRGLITTSGRLRLTTLDEVTNTIIADYSNRPVDWVVTLNGLVVATVHVNDSITYPS